MDGDIYGAEFCAVQEVAERAGRSVEVLLRVCAKCLDDGEQLANNRIQTALNGAE